MSFFLIKCAPFFSKFMKIVILMVKREKLIESGEIHFYNTF
jgi:hypothetical protein